MESKPATGKARAKRKATPRTKTAKSAASRKPAPAAPDSAAIKATNLAEEALTRVDQLSSNVNDLMRSQNEILKALEHMRAKDRPISFNQTRVETEELDGDDESGPSVVTVGDGPARVRHGRPIDINSAAYKAKMAEESFMQDRLTIHFHESEDENAQRIFPASVNGRKYVFIRGRTYTEVPRFIVSMLCEARPLSYGNEEYIDPQDKIMKVRYPKRRMMRYPFSVEEDPAGARGREWLQKKMKAA